MDCFVHPGSGAVAICKTCCKGICHRCARPHELGIYCSAECADHGAKMQTVNKRVLKLYSVGEARTPLGSAVVIYGVLGLAFSIFGLWSAFQAEAIDKGDTFAIAMGLVLLAVAGYARFRQVKTGLNC